MGGEPGVAGAALGEERLHIGGGLGAGEPRRIPDRVLEHRLGGKVDRRRQPRCTLGEERAGVERE